MSEETASGNTSFDLEKLQQLVQMMEKHGLSEVNLRRGEEQWRLRRGPVQVSHAIPQIIPAASNAPIAAAAPMFGPPPAVASESSGLIDIKSQRLAPITLRLHRGSHHSSLSVRLSHPKRLSAFWKP